MRNIDDYSIYDLKRLFDLELEKNPENKVLEKFRSFVKTRKFSKKDWPYSYHMWVVECVHKFVNR